MKVRIYQPAKTAMQSGRGKTKRWALQFEETGDRFIDPLMGWVGQKNTQQQLALSFSSKEEAIQHCKKKKYDYSVIEPAARNIKGKAYADNFAFNKITTNPV